MAVTWPVKQRALDRLFVLRYFCDKVLALAVVAKECEAFPMAATITVIVASEWNYKALLSQKF